MKLLDQLSARARAVGRRAVGRVRAPSLPASLSLRLDDLDGAAPVAGDLSLEAWQSRVVGLLLATGIVPVRVIGRAAHPLLPELARFAHRLDTPVTVRTSAVGLDAPVAQALVDAGVKRFQVLGDAGDDEAVTAAVAALRAAGRERAVSVDVVVELPAGPRFRERLAEVRADGARVRVPWSGVVSPAVLAEVRGWTASAHRTAPATLTTLARYDGAGPGAPREGGRCSIATRRWELAADGSLYACPFKPGRLALPADGAVGAGLDAHREAVAACDRVCVHADLD